MILSVACISIKLESQEEDTEVDTNYIYWALLTGMGGPVLMSTRHVVIKYFGGCYEAWAMCIDSFIIEYAMFIPITVLLLNSEEYEFAWMDFVIGTGAGVIICIGRIGISVAVQKGIASCSQSLMSTHGVWQAIWSAVIASQWITWLQGLGLALSMLGVFTIGFVQYFLDYLQKQKASPKV